MPLNKLDNFIKNTEGRILYVSPADLDSTDSIDNTGNSLARPFKTIQRALLESARFSYVKGTSNDLTERTTILLMPGDHLIDNRPGYKLFQDGDFAKVVPPGYTTSSTTTPNVSDTAQDVLRLSLESSFDLTKQDNILYKFNSAEGGVIVPRGTSIVGLDLRKTKIKPLYVPNPTASEEDTPPSAIFRITGACYFWQFSFFDGDENGLVYTDPSDFTDNNRSRPLFSHHKLTCFEYADGVNSIPIGSFDTGLSDLDMYYAKISNAYGSASGSPNRDIDQKFPTNPDGFSKQRPEWEIVGAFASDPIDIDTIDSGSNGIPSNTVTVTTRTDHNLTAGTPIKIRGVKPSDYNISTKVATVSDTNPRQFTYQLPSFRTNLETLDSVNSSNGEVVIETDTVSGASPYIFNISLRSVYGMNGMQADGAKADGFRSMVVAQFTGVSLQKDDRAFVKYDKTSRKYNGILYTKVTGSNLPAGSAATNTPQVYHLDPQATYRKGWEQTHIRIKNDSILQIVSVFAIGYNKHFNCESGSDASVTNSNSNFGQLSLVSDGFKKQAFAKDNKAYITNIFTPKSIETQEEDIDWLNIDVDTTLKANAELGGTSNNRLYIAGFNSRDNIPPVLTQGYRVGAKRNDVLYVNIGSTTKSASILFTDTNNTTHSSSRELRVQSVTDTKLDFGDDINSNPIIPRFATGEKVLIVSDTGEYPENIIPHQVYYVIAYDANTTPNNTRISLASTKTDAENGNAIKIYGGSNLKIVSRVTDKIPGEAGHPIKWDDTTQIDRGNGLEYANRWYIVTNINSDIYTELNTLGASAFENEETEPTFIKRKADLRSLDEKIYKMRVVIPKELKNGKTPEAGFIIQESSTTNLRDNDDFSPEEFSENNNIKRQQITLNDYEFEKNPRFISTCTYNSINSIASFITELPHNMRVGEKVIIKNVTDANNPLGNDQKGYNGTFEIASILSNNMGFTVINNNVPSPSSVSNNSTDRTIDLPVYQRNDTKSNYYIYRNETISEYIEDQQDGVYHIYALRSDVNITEEFTDLKYSQNVTDLYPQLDRDNPEDSPKSAKSYALRSPIGEVHTSDLKDSITRDTATKFISQLTKDLIVDSVDNNNNSSGLSTVTFTRNHSYNGIYNGYLSSVDTHVDSPVGKMYHNVKLLDRNESNPFAVPYTPTSGNWRGATAKVTVSGNQITEFQIQSRGSGYKNTDVLFFDNSIIGGNVSQYSSNITSLDIIDGSSDYVQVTGISTISDGYYRIDNVKSENEIVLIKPLSDGNAIVPGHSIINIGKSIAVQSYNNGTVICTQPHGLVKGNRFRFINNSGENLGDFIIDSKSSPTEFTIDTTKGIPSGTPTFALKHFMSANDAVSDASQESIAARGNTFYDNDSIKLSQDLEIFMSSPNQNIVQNHLRVRNLNANNQNGIVSRFPIGTYIQIDDEIMRVARTDLYNTEYLIVIRGVLGTNISRHSANSLIKKIKPIPTEFRRPSIIRASGHTFEYLGYGPGNYSTGLPQVQTRTLTEKEEFLSQAQERSAGIVVYTGMNNKGDFYIGNTKKSSATGEEVSFDTPIPTVAGEDAARLSAIFDEVTVKERIVVEGGDSGQILSQFDGPVTFNKEIRVKNTLNVSGTLKVKNEVDSTSSTTGSVQIAGGVGVAKSVFIGGDLDVDGGVGIAKTLNIGGTLNALSGIRVGYEESIEENHLRIYNLNSDTSFNSVIQNKKGSLIIRNVHETTPDGIGNETDRYIYIRAKGSEGSVADEDSIRCQSNGFVKLYYNGGEKLSTINTGVSITGELQVSGDITAFYTSDQRLKDNVTAIDDPLAKVLSLGGYTFDWNENTTKEGTETGVIAQEVEALGLPGLVTTRDNGYKAVNYEKLVPLLIEAVKELSGKVDALEEKLSDK